MKIFKCNASETFAGMIKDEKIVKNQDGGVKVPLFNLKQ